MLIRLTKDLVVQTERGDIVSEDKMSLNVEQTHDRTGRPVATLHTAAAQDDSQVCHEADMLNIEDEILRKRTERSVADHDVSHESMMVNEAHMDFRIPGLPHSVVKHAQCTSVRQLTWKIENHIHILQKDLQQNQSFNLFSPESKQMIRDVGNIELCELLETEPKTQCKVCVSYWDTGILYCTCVHLLYKEREANQQFINYTMDFLSIPEYVIKKGRPHGHRHGKKTGKQGIPYGAPVEQEMQEKVFPRNP